ncbi:DUF6153 family protein [Streptomyces sp. NPDC050315]|uniref:DUF6153 family protein n=1 Tax=Streptomyces sp. NPDC050315 TaxID=3155039 RepID=UPI0034476594
MTARRRARAAGAWAHLLLVVVLALGIFVMHTLGHPEGSSHGHDEMAPVSVSASVQAVHASPSSHEPSSHEPSSHDGTKTSSHKPGMGMDMTSLCVAILGAGVLIGLLRATLGSRADWLVRLRAGLMAALRPNAPPPRPDLTQLSILRI